MTNNCLLNFIILCDEKTKSIKIAAAIIIFALILPSEIIELKP